MSVRGNLVSDETLTRAHPFNAHVVPPLTYLYAALRKIVASTKYLESFKMEHYWPHFRLKLASPVPLVISCWGGGFHRPRDTLSKDYVLLAACWHTIFETLMPT